MNPEPQVTLSILTWKSPNTLRQTLASLHPLGDIFCERIVICQENDDREVALSQEHGYHPIINNHNLGIQEGLALAVENALSDLVLVLENDCKYIGGSTGISVLKESFSAFQKYNLDVIKLGEYPFLPKKRYFRYWGKSFPPKRTLRGILRWREANSCKAEAFKLSNFNANQVAEIEEITDTLLITSSKFIPWSNRAFLVRKSFFLHTLLNFARSNPTSRLANGRPDLEHAINSGANRNWWRESEFRVGLIKPGLFGHHRQDRPDTDEKRKTRGI